MSNTTTITTFKGEMEALFEKRKQRKEEEKMELDKRFAALDENTSATAGATNGNLDYKKVIATAGASASTSKPTLFDFDDMF